MSLHFTIIEQKKEGGNNLDPLTPAMQIIIKNPLNHDVNLREEQNNEKSFN